jgi:predicted CoA-binding protein
MKAAGRCEVKRKIDAADIKAAMEQIDKIVDQLRRLALPDVAWFAEAVKAADIKAANENAKRRAAKGGEA